MWALTLNTTLLSGQRGEPGAPGKEHSKLCVRVRRTSTSFVQNAVLIIHELRILNSVTATLWATQISADGVYTTLQFPVCAIIHRKQPPRVPRLISSRGKEKARIFWGVFFSVANCPGLSQMALLHLLQAS